VKTPRIAKIQNCQLGSTIYQQSHLEKSSIAACTSNRHPSATGRAVARSLATHWHGDEKTSGEENKHCPHTTKHFLAFSRMSSDTINVLPKQYMFLKEV
jgi:hypothetical protein